MKTYETVEDQIKHADHVLRANIALIAASVNSLEESLPSDLSLPFSNNLPHAILIAARMVCHAVNKDPERADRLFWEAFCCLKDGFPLEDGVIDTEKMIQWFKSDDRTPPATDI